MLRQVIFTGAVAGLFALGGCADMDQMNAEAAAQQHASDQARCAGYGFQPGTESFANCMMKTTQDREQTQADQRRQDAFLQQRKQEVQAQQKAQHAQQEAADRAANEKHQDDIMKMMRSNSDQGFTPPMPQVATPPTPQVGIPAGSNCTSTTTSTQTGNAGSSNTTTVCH